MLQRICGTLGMLALLKELLASDGGWLVMSWRFVIA
jgi:hypothetical protein